MQKKKIIRYFLYTFCLIAISGYAKFQGLENMENMKLMISQEEIKSKIIEIAQIVDQEYKDKEIVILMIMKGSFIFTSDFVREIKTPFSIQAVSCSSYGQKGKKRGELVIRGLENLNLESKHVLIIDDIFDSGNTFETIRKEVEKQNPSSVKSLAMLLKKTPKRIKEVALPDYYLFEIEDKFVVGYGLDYKEYFRGLKGVYSIE